MRFFLKSIVLYGSVLLAFGCKSPKTSSVNGTSFSSLTKSSDTSRPTGESDVNAKKLSGQLGQIQPVTSVSIPSGTSATSPIQVALDCISLIGCKSIRYSLNGVDPASADPVSNGSVQAQASQADTAGVQ